MPDFEPAIRFRDNLQLLNPDILNAVWRECQPKILVVTDGLSFSSASGFGLTQFISTLSSSTIHGMTPQVLKASRSGALAGADIPNFTFDNATTGVLKSRYDVVFVIGFDREGVNQLSAGELAALGRFMQAGGGLFATGDHESLGAAMGRDIPRVRQMRQWRQADTPDADDPTRLSTNVAGSNEAEDFSDQSDRLPQSLYPNFRTNAGNPGALATPGFAHPLLQLPAAPGISRPVIEVFPDHPHEGRCLIPTSATTTFSLDGTTVDEWPAATAGGGRVLPEVVAMTMSHGTGFAAGSKQPLAPSAFIAVSAYDGHLANVGRVATDATWHHLVNINLDGTGSGLSGLQNPGTPPTDTVALTRVRQYFKNLATWLMPKNVRRCLRRPLLIEELARFPLFEELVFPPKPGPGPGPGPDPSPLVRLGEQVMASLASHLPRWQAEAMLADALADAVGDKTADQLLQARDTIAGISARELSLAALGAITLSTAETLSRLSDLKDIVPHKTFEPDAKMAARNAVRSLVAQHRDRLQRCDGLLRQALGNDAEAM